MTVSERSPKPGTKRGKPGAGSPLVVGWREWISMPEIGVDLVKAKVDTGARSSSLHAFDIEIIRKKNAVVARFKIHPNQHDFVTSIEAEAPLVEERKVRSSGGHETIRPVIRTKVRLGSRLIDIDLTLASRDNMGFRMLLGREALRSGILVNAGESYLLGKPKSAKKRKMN